MGPSAQMQAAVDPKWGITKRIWIPPTAHTEAGK